MIPRRLEVDGRRAGHGGARPPKPEDNGRRTHPAGSPRGMAGRVPRNWKTTDAAPVQQTASGGMAGVIPRRPAGADAGRVQLIPTWTARRKIKKDLASCQIFPVSIF